MFLEGGYWYVIADDQLSGEERTFRIDRIEHCRLTGVVDPRREVEVPHGDSWFADDELPAALLRVPAGGGWVAERYPTRLVQADGDGWLIEVTVASERWLRDLLLRLGSEAEVVRPAEWVGLGAAAASELLRRYERWQRRQLIDPDDAVRLQQMRQHRGSGIGIGQRIVRASELDVVTRAQIGEAMRQLSLRVELAREPQRAQWLGDR